MRGDGVFFFFCVLKSPRSDIYRDETVPLSVVFFPFYVENGKVVVSKYPRMSPPLSDRYLARKTTRVSLGPFSADIPT